MNSLGVSPYVSYLYSDLHDGLIILQLEDIIRPGCVDWAKIIKKFNAMKILFEKLRMSIFLDLIQPLNRRYRLY